MIELTTWRSGRDCAVTAEVVPHNRRPPDHATCRSQRFTVAQARHLVALGAGEDSGLTDAEVAALRDALQ